MPFDKVAWSKAYRQKRRLDPEFRKREVEYTRLWRERNNVKHLTWRKAYDAKRYQDPEIRAGIESNNKRRLADPKIRARKLETTRLWQDKNSGRFRACKAAYMAHRLKNDPAYRILVNCRRRLLHALRGRGTKSARTLELLGCSPQQLKLHLEAQFSPAMTWENYGAYWQIDHIFPCASFDLACPTQQRQCFHFSNLQPLEARENLLKSDHYARYK